MEQVERLTGLDRFGTYLTLLFEVDMLFGNEDRHLNNIAVLRCGDGFDYCPIFDFGRGFAVQHTGLSHGNRTGRIGASAQGFSP